MTDVLFSDYFGTYNDFLNLTKWFQTNYDAYRDVIFALRDRSDLELEYAQRLSKINVKIQNGFRRSGTVNNLWTKAALLMNEEAMAHKNLGNQISEKISKPLTHISEKYNKLKNMIQTDIEKCYKLYNEKREEECKLKKKAFMGAKETEKTFEALEDFKITHPSSVSGSDNQRNKMDRKAGQLDDQSMKAEEEYLKASLVSESIRYKYEQSYISGLEKMQTIEMDRLKSMKTIMESYYQSISQIPSTYLEISTKLLREIDTVNIREDVFRSCMDYTNNNPNVYKSEQLLVDFYAESKMNKMELNRRRDKLMTYINLLFEYQRQSHRLRTGTQKMLVAYKNSEQTTDELTINRTKREYEKAQSAMNLLSSNIYKVQLALSSFDCKPEPLNPLISEGARIVMVNDRYGLLQSVLETRPGTILPFFDPGTISRSNSNVVTPIVVNNPVDDDEYDFDEEYKDCYGDSDNEVCMSKSSQSRISVSSSNSSSNGKPPPKLPKPLPVIDAVVPAKISQMICNEEVRQAIQIRYDTMPKAPRPLPPLPTTIRCEAEFDYVGRDSEELSFKKGDIIWVMNKLSDIWWNGQLEGRSGLVPTNYVRELK